MLQDLNTQPYTDGSSAREGPTLLLLIIYREINDYSFKKKKKKKKEKKHNIQRNVFKFFLDILNLHLDQMQALKSTSPGSCKTPATSIDPKHPNKQRGKNKESTRKIKLQTN